jgi:TolB-like protein/DNA-binding winged helix-turn-helix (wHTH) protein/Tfp pilus assembly protein PilF
MVTGDQGADSHQRWHSGDLIIDAGTRQVFRDGEELAVPGLSFDLLSVLVRAAPNVVSPDELMDQVWAGQVVSPETISQRVKLLRQALGDDPHDPRYIALVRGHGWRWVASVDTAMAHAEQGSHIRRNSRPVLAAAGVLGAVGLIWLGVQMIPTSAPQAVPESSLAVLPFDNRSEHPDDAWLADGLHDEVLVELSRIPDLRVISRTSVLPYRDRALSIPEIARELDVGVVLEGAIQRVGENIRLTVQLIDGGDDRHLWAERFDRALNPESALEIQREISRAVAEQLELALLPPEREHSPVAATDGTAGYDAYLLGWRELDRHTPEGIDAAIGLFEQALAADPEFALAWVGLAEARLIQWRYRFLHADVAARLADAAIERALALIPDLPEAIAAHAERLWLAGDWETAEAEFRRAIALNPNLARAHIRYGFMLLTNPADHRPTEAIELWRTAGRLDPHSHVLRQHLAWAEFRAGRFEEAGDMLRSILEQHPDYPVAWFVHGEMLAGAGDQAGAVDAYRRALELNPHVARLANYGLVEALIDLELDEEAWAALESTRAIPDAPVLTLRLEFKLIVQTARAEPDLERARAILAELREKQPPVDPYYEIVAFHEATLHLLEGRPDAAREAMEAAWPRLAAEPGALPRDGFWRALFCTQAHALVATGEVERGLALARWLLTQLEVAPDHARRRHHDPIVCNTVLGDTEHALAVLRAAAESGVPSGWRFMTVRPELEALRSHPEFEEIVASIRAEAARQRALLTMQPAI